VDVDQDLPTQRLRFHQEQERRRALWVTAQQFSRAIQGERIVPTALPDGAGPVHRGTLKNQINRLTGTTPGAEEGGGLFEFEETFQKVVTVYALLQLEFESKVQELLDYLASSGFGKRKAVGYGSLELTPRLESFPGFGDPPEPNGFVSLSTFVPARHDPSNGFWNLLVKYGKLGEELAYSENPFKKPLLMLRAGATFYDNPVREFYGRLVEGVSPRYDFVMQPAFSLPVPMLLPPPPGQAATAGGEAPHPSLEARP
jgi:CRISPR-associated protein Csm4